MDEILKGLVGGIQRFSTSDGPGIRTTVFLKGCPLDCKWCHNPELISVKQQLMRSVTKCIGCGCCVAACKNGSAMLFVSAKVSQFALLPQGKAEAARRAKAMVAKMDELGFGNCTNTGACAAECPKNISLSNIARLNREYICAKVKD